MKNLILFLNCAFPILLFAQKTNILNPIADDGIGFHIAANAANINYHNDNWVIAHVQPGGLGIAMDTGRTLILFDFKTVPSNAKVKRITIFLVCLSFSSGFNL